MLKHLITSTAIAITMTAAVASAGEARFAEKAPALENVEWIKGDAVNTFKKDHVYVLDFWATWCGPCIASIPHLNDLQEEHKGEVTFIGVAIWPRDGMTPTDEFVAEKGDAMAYHICEDIDGKTAETYMNAMGRNGIPTAMIIDKQGKIAWVGHPSYPQGEMDKAIEQILAGEYDMAAATSEWNKEWERTRAERENRAKARSFAQGIRECIDNEEYDNAIAKIDEAYDWNPGMFSGFLVQKYRIMAEKMDAPAKASRFGAKLVEDEFANNANALNALAWEIATEAPEDKRDLKLAMNAAKRADELTDGAHPGIIDTLARVHFIEGEVDKAIELQKKAIKIAEKQNPQFAQQLQPALDEYLAAKSSM